MTGAARSVRLSRSPARCRCWRRARRENHSRELELVLRRPRRPPLLFERPQTTRARPSDRRPAVAPSTQRRAALCSRAMGFFRVRHTLASVLGVGLPSALLGSCGSSAWECEGVPPACGDRASADCQPGMPDQCLPGPACEPPLCDDGPNDCKSPCVWHPDPSSSSSYLVGSCALSTDEPCTGSTTQAQCQSNPGCLWRAECHGQALACYHFPSEVQCQAVHGCFWNFWRGE